ncbi:heavy metal transporter [Aphanothece hegewaldii CCALA 016]|uniref:Heavy metal transporter n=1 Tax=Aphanothece hegewaldii CCALA 016 TaxID=2107694 RepID=A0A2T1M403_9CHRO|nr:heavy-metal-associated domain-containing protein [Aphanothece hegewaldii]PSF39573.1 heavy metal transporter [Aphanothece hegewaldii CCALA 016]
MSFQVTVTDMACSACSDTITKAIQTIDPTAKVNADPKTKLVSVDTLASFSEIKQAITTAGYTVT